VRFTSLFTPLQQQLVASESRGCIRVSADKKGMMINPPWTRLLHALPPPIRLKRANGGADRGRTLWAQPIRMRISSRSLADVGLGMRRRMYL